MNFLNIKSSYLNHLLYRGVPETIFYLCVQLSWSLIVLSKRNFPSSVPFLQVTSPKSFIRCVCLFSHVCHIPCPSLPPLITIVMYGRCTIHVTSRCGCTSFLHTALWTQPAVHFVPLSKFL